MEKIDLHIHSNLSDGLLSPEEIVQLSLKNNCNKISITDHELINDYSHLEQKYGILIIPGIEFNTSVRNLHILGYGMTDLEKINKVTTELRIINEGVCKKVINLLQDDNFDISLNKLKDYLKSINLSYDIIDKRKIVKYLIYKGYVTNVIEAYIKLIGLNRKYYVPNIKISPYKIIELIDQCHGISVLAHPNTLNFSNEDLLKRIINLKNYGLFGIEVLNKKMQTNNINFYAQIADELELIKTAGSDFHDSSVDSIGIKVSNSFYNGLKKQLILSKK